MLVVPFVFSPPSPSSSPPISNPTTHTTAHAKTDFNEQEKKYDCCSRRDASLILAGTAFLAAQQRPTPAVAATLAAEQQQQQQPSISTQYNQFFFRQLQSVPTFCIVTNEGIPFHVLHKNSDTTHSITTTPTTSSTSSLSAHGYFFLSYEAATQALQRLREQDPDQGQVQGEGSPDSSSSASDGGGVSVSSTAKIITIPLGMALEQSLSTTTSQREVMNANKINNNANNHLPTHHHLVVSSEGRDDAKRIEKEFLERGGRNNLYNNPQNHLHQNNLNNDFEKNKKNKLPSPPSQWEQPEKIPLFYIEGLTVSNGKYEPRYFTQDDLLEEYTDQHPDQKLPPTQLVDLLDLYRTAVLDDKESQVNEVSNNLVFVPASSETVPVGKKLPTTAILPNEYYNAQQIYLVDQ